MRIRTIRALLYVCSAIMVVGLGLFSFEPQTQAEVIVGVKLPDGSTTPPAPSGTVAPPSLTPTPTLTPAPTYTPTPSPVPTNTNTPTPTATSTPTPTPTNTPTPTPSLGEVNATLPLRLLAPQEDEILYNAVINHVTALAAADSGIKSVENITCYYKDGVAFDYFIYVTYDVIYKNSAVAIPTLDVLFVSWENNDYVFASQTDDADVQEALYLSRGQGDVLTLYLKETIRRYMNAKLFENDSIITPLVTDTYYLNFEDIKRKNEFIERYVILDYIIRECPDTVTEFDYIIYVINDVDIVNIETLAPGLDELMITMDENNYPKIFLGITSDETDEFRENSKKQEDYLTASDDVTTRLYKAWESDTALFEFVQRLYETN